MRPPISKKRPRPYVVIECRKWRVVDECGDVVASGRMPKSWPPPGVSLAEDRVYILQIAGILRRLPCAKPDPQRDLVDLDPQQDGTWLGEYFMRKALALMERQGGLIRVPWRDRATWGIAGPS